MSYHTGNQLVDPHLLFLKAHLRAGMHVGDLGCGRTGHLVFPAAMVIGEHGILYAVDIMKEILENIRKRARMDGLLNVHTVWADLETVGKTAVPAGSLDVAFLVNTLTHSKKRMEMLEESARLLKDKARCIVVDWQKSGMPFAPKEEEFVDFESIKSWARDKGFAVQEEFEAGPYHRGLVLYKHD